MKTTKHNGNTITTQDGVEIYYKDWGPRDADLDHHRNPRRDWLVGGRPNG